MAAAIPIAAKVAPFAIGAIGGLLGKKSQPKIPPYAPNAAYTQPMSQFAGSLLPMAQQGFQTAFNYYSPLAQGNEQALATATASGAADVGRQAQQLTQRAARTQPRGGAQAAIMASLPQQQMAAGLGRRIEAQQNAAQNLSSLASTAGGMGTNVFGGLLGNELGGYQASTNAAYTNLAQTQANRNYYGGIGGGIYDILTGKIPGTQGSILDKILNRGKKPSVPGYDDQFGNPGPYSGGAG